MSKQLLRARMRSARDAFVAERRPTLSVPAEFKDRLTAGMIVACYFPIGSEVDPIALVHAAADAGCALALPFVVDRETPMQFRHWSPGTALTRGPFGLSQPPEDAPRCRPDIVLTPLVAFDRALNRLGQGAGHYDRAFAEHPDAWRVGVAWAVQQVDALVADPWDVPLHAVVTEREWMTS